MVKHARILLQAQASRNMFHSSVSQWPIYKELILH